MMIHWLTVNNKSAHNDWRLRLVYDAMIGRWSWLTTIDGDVSIAWCSLLNWWWRIHIWWWLVYDYHWFISDWSMAMMLDDSWSMMTDADDHMSIIVTKYHSHSTLPPPNFCLMMYVRHTQYHMADRMASTVLSAKAWLHVLLVGLSQKMWSDSKQSVWNRVRSSVIG